MSEMTNSLIEERPEDTLLNVQCLLHFMNEFHTKVCADNDASSNSHHALALIAQNAADALSFEMERAESSGVLAVQKSPSSH